jgi:hypothetical protein
MCIIITVLRQRIGAFHLALVDLIGWSNNLSTVALKTAYGILPKFGIALRVKAVE